MSFGLKDSDWVDPYDRQDGPMRCDECANGRQCPGNSGYYYCLENDEFFTPEDDETCMDFRWW